MLLVFAGAQAYGQYELDALRFSRPYATGTARFVGMGGAFGAIGGDITTISHNPAGLGLFRNSSITVSPSLFFTHSGTGYEGAEFNDSKFNFNFGNVGLVYSRRFNKTKTKGLQFLNFAIAYNRVNNFNRSYFFEGDDSLNSIGTYMQTNAQGLTPSALNPFQELLAFNSYLIDTAGGPTSYFTNGPFPGETKRMLNRTDSKGSAGEIALAGAINLGNKFFIGANISVGILNYKNTYTYSETDVTGSIPVFDNLTYRENLDVSGVGVSLKVGAIYRPLNWLRVGLAIHSPTWYNMSEDYFNELNTSFTFGKFSTNSAVGHFEYDLATPWKLQASAAFVILKNAVIGVDYELIDYSSINLRSSSGSFTSANAFIDSAYAVSHNVKIGAEYRIDPFRIRAGYQFQMNPFVSSLGPDATAHHISVGAGYHSKRWFSADIAYMISLTNGSDSMFRGFDLPQAQINIINHSLVITGAVNF